jgi:hypothetical protein
MFDLDTTKTIDYLNEYYWWWVEYKNWEFYLNWIKLSLDTMASVNFIKWLSSNDRIDMNQFTWSVMRYVIENYKWKGSIIEFLSPMLK